MASLWRHIYLREAIKKDFQENFHGKTFNAELKESALLQVNNLLGKLETEEQRNKENEKKGEIKKYDNFVTALETLLSVWEYAATNSSDPDKKEQRDMVEVYVECIARGSKIIFLSGEWMQLDSSTKSHLEKTLYKVKEQVPASSNTVEGLISLARSPWGGTTVRNLLSGRIEKEEEVLGLVSSEGVETVLLRIELLVEGGLDKQAYKAVAAVANSLLADDMIRESYSSTSPPGCIERITDIFIASCVAQHRETRLFKALKLIGLNDVNHIFIQRFGHYLNNTTYIQEYKEEKKEIKEEKKEESNEEKKEESNEEKKEENEEKVETGENKILENDVEMKSLETTDDKKEENEPKEETEMKNKVENKTDEDKEQGDDTDESDPEVSAAKFQLLEKGRCERLFSVDICLKSLENIFQWSIAGAAIRQTSVKLQEYLISSWLSKCSANKERLLEDVEALMETSKQTSFLYTLAHQLYKHLGAEVETKVLSIFIRALTSDINEIEAAKRSKTSKNHMEERLARGFVLLSEVVGERVSLARECVLTAFSIKPELSTLNRIREFARISGIDQEQVEDEITFKEKEAEEEEPRKSGLHCRVTSDGGSGKTTFLKAHDLKSTGRVEEDSSTQNLEDFSKYIDSYQENVAGFIQELDNHEFSAAHTKLRSNKSRELKKIKNLEGLVAIRGELITEAANYYPGDVPCKSLQPENLNLAPNLTDDLLIVVSAPRWHMLSWVMAWSKLEQSCLNLLKDPTLREPIEDLKYLNIDYTQFNGWSSDEEVTIYTGIEKGYEKWLLDGPDSDDGKISEKEASSEEEFDHSIDFENYNDPDKYLVPEDYLRDIKPEENAIKTEEEFEKKEDNEETIMDVCEDKLTSDVKSDGREDSQESPNDPAAKTQMEKRSSAKDKKSGKQPDEKSAKKRKADSEIFPEVVLDEFCKENPDSPMVGKTESKSMEVDN